MNVSLSGKIAMGTLIALLSAAGGYILTLENVKTRVELLEKSQDRVVDRLDKIYDILTTLKKK